MARTATSKTSTFAAGGNRSTGETRFPIAAWTWTSMASYGKRFRGLAKLLQYLGRRVINEAFVAGLSRRVVVSDSIGLASSLSAAMMISSDTTFSSRDFPDNLHVAQLETFHRRSSVLLATWLTTRVLAAAMGWRSSNSLLSECFGEAADRFEFLQPAEAFEQPEWKNRRTGKSVGGGALFGTILGAVAGGGKAAGIGPWPAEQQAQ